VDQLDRDRRSHRVGVSATDRRRTVEDKERTHALAAAEDRMLRSSAKPLRELLLAEEPGEGRIDLCDQAKIRIGKRRSHGGWC
jgi:hypothetical protein